MIKMISCKIGASLKIAQAIGMIFIIGGAGIVTLPTSLAANGEREADNVAPDTGFDTNLNVKLNARLNPKLNAGLNAGANGYTTITIGDYIFACMASNGQTRQVLENCACSIDVISSLITYEQYVEAETILRIRQLGGEKSAPFRQITWVEEIVGSLRAAQAEAEIRCFG